MKTFYLRHWLFSIFLLLHVTLLCASCNTEDSNQETRSVSEGPTSLPAEPNREWQLGATEESPIYSFGYLYVAEDRIYVPDVRNNKILAFDKAGELKDEWGRQGGGPKEFKSPNQVLIDNQKRVFISDSENRRVQIFDSSGSLIKIINTPTTVNQEIMINRNVGDNSVWVVGRASCGTKSCAVHKYDVSSGKNINSFAKVRDDVLIYSWLSGRDPANGDMYLSQVMSSSVRVFNKNGKYKKSIKLSSPSTKSLYRSNEKPESPREIIKLIGKKRHTQVLGIFVTSTYIVVQFKRYNFKDKFPFVTDIYDKKGNLISYGTESSARLVQAKDDALYFAKLEESAHGKLHIFEYALNNFVNVQLSDNILGQSHL